MSNACIRKDDFSGVRLYGVSRHEDGAKRNPNGQCGGKREALGGGSVCGIMWIYEIQERY